MGRLLRLLKRLLGSRQFDAELAEELESHRAMKQAAFERSGMPSAEAAYASRRALGNVTLAREDAREVWIWPSFERLWQDVKYGARALAHQPTFAATAILTLSIGIGATTAVYSVVEAELWRPLPFPRPDRLATAFLTAPGPRRTYESLSAPDFLQWQTQNQTFDGLASYGSLARRVLRKGGLPEFVRARPVSANFFSVLGRQPALGRVFEAEDGRSSRAVMLTDASWQRLFDADPHVVGRAISLDDAQYAIVGVLPPDTSLEFTEDADLYVAAELESDALRRAERRDLSVVGRLKDGVGVAEAQADLQTIFGRLAHDRSELVKSRQAFVEPLNEYVDYNNWPPLYFFLGAALFVLLLSCVNVANLLLARALRRQREFAIRSALGGGRAALVRQLLVEGLLLALPGTAAGILIALWGVDILTSWLPAGYRLRGGHVRIDARVCAFALAVGGLTTVVFGLAPAFFTRLDLTAALAPGSRAMGGSRSQRRARHALVVAEVTSAFILVFGAGLFLNSFVRLTNLPLGFDTRDRLSVSVPLIGPRYEDPQAVIELSRRLLDEMQSIPGVLTATVASSVPLASGPAVDFAPADRPMPAAGEEPRAIVRAVTPEYFRTFAIRQLSGRAFTSSDVEGSPRVAVINETLARRFFADRDPVGRELVLLPGARGPWIRRGRVQIVGVVTNTKDVGIHEVDFNNIYLPFPQSPPNAIQVGISAAVPPATLVDSIRQAVVAADSQLAVLGITAMTQRATDALRSNRFNLFLIGTFAGIALLLAAIGIYGVMSYSIQQRTPEFGLRLALGARKRGILALALGQALRLGVAGAVLGLGLALIIARALGNALYLVQGEHEGLIYGVTTTDPLTLICAAAAVTIAAALAGFVPARRAMSVEPAAVLRE